MSCVSEIPVYHDKDLKVITSGGIEITNLEVIVAPKRQNVQGDPILEKHVFVPYISKNISEATNIEQSLRMALQIVIENNGLLRNLLVYEMLTREENSLAKMVIDISKTEPLLNVTFVDGLSQNVDLILCSDGHFDKVALKALNKDGFVLFYGFEERCTSSGLPIVYQNSFSGKGKI